MARIHILCRNYTEDRIIPRMARYLADRWGWSVGDVPGPVDGVYLSAYFEAQLLSKLGLRGMPTVAYFTHREETPSGNAKAALFDRVAKAVDVRLATCKLYADILAPMGVTMLARPPVELDRFVPRSTPGSGRIVAGLSGYTYANARKGEDLVHAILDSQAGQAVTWCASGRGWPVPTRRYSWAEMPGYYQSLDILVCTSRVEGVPMPPLEALACGVPVVIPEGVGLLDELPQVCGIYRYQRGDAASLEAAFARAVAECRETEPGALRAAVSGYSVPHWCTDVRRAMVKALDSQPAPKRPRPPATIETKKACEKLDVHASTRGIYLVAFGAPARDCARRLVDSIRAHMPDIPIVVAGLGSKNLARFKAEHPEIRLKRGDYGPLGSEDLFLDIYDGDVGGRRVKLRAYELAPSEWRTVLYLDADTEVVAPVYRFFEWLEDGWELVITKDPHLMDELENYRRRTNLVEMAELEAEIRTLHALQYNGGVWGFRRCAEVKAFFERWLSEWERHKQRDQGPLLRALYQAPLRVLLLGNEWNTFDKYSKGVTTAGVRHYPGEARRWRGQIDGPITGAGAWASVAREQRRKGV